MRHLEYCVSVASFCLALLAVPQAGAVLGGTIASVQKTQKALPGVARKAQVESMNPSLYTVQELITSGITVREYASADGKIFAVTWRGVAEPDLNTLFGDYYTEYKSENEKEPATRSSYKVTTTTAIQVRRSGHMRDKRGLAFISANVPAGLSLEELK